MQKRLCKSRTDKMIAGVCGGIANYLNCDPTCPLPDKIDTKKHTKVE